jgi:hypothetical protein
VPSVFINGPLNVAMIGDAVQVKLTVELPKISGASALLFWSTAPV